MAVAAAEVFTHNSSDEDSNDDKENDEAPAYLKYEDFTHTPLGLETYNDGLQHPIELRRILTGDLSNEISVSYKESPEESFRNLSYPKLTKRPASVEPSPSISVYSTSSLLPKPPKLLKGSGSSISNLSGVNSLSNVPGWLEDHSNSQGPASLTDNMSDYMGHSSFMPISPRKPGRPPTAGGSFDPETGSVRYSCRLHCGASLASAKGRRKHEKKHCPNFGKVEPPILRGQQPRTLQPPGALGQPANPLGFAHSLFGAFAAQNTQTKERRVYECRYCGKVLKTYEGRRLHEKLQHVAKNQIQSSNNEDDSISAEDNKQLLIEHLKAAGMDPDCLDDSDNPLANQDDDNICAPAVELEYGEDDDEDEDDYNEPSSDGVQEVQM